MQTKYERTQTKDQDKDAKIKTLIERIDKMKEADIEVKKSIQDKD